MWVGEWDSEVLCVWVRAQSPVLVTGAHTVKCPEEVRRAAAHWKMAFALVFFISGEG